MNIKHLGDAFDFWKGGIIRLLNVSLNDLHVYPMFTDTDVSNAWTPGCIQLYASLIGVDVSKVLLPLTRFETSIRGKYFKMVDIRADADLFVDPDTGIASDRAGKIQHIRLCEINQLLPADSSRIVMIYQHSWHKITWVDDCLKKVCSYHDLKGSATFAYMGSSVAMIFISRSQRRLKAVHQIFGKFMESTLPDTSRVSPINLII